MSMQSAGNWSRRLALDAVLVALALGLSQLERLVPLQLLVPLPGVRLGLANLVTLYGVCFLPLRETLCITMSRCLLGALFGGGITAFLFSLLGGLAAVGIMWLARRGLDRCFSLLGVSMLGAAAHHVGQIVAAVLTLGSWAPLAYLPVLLLSAAVTGSVLGIVATGLWMRLSTGSSKPED